MLAFAGRLPSRVRFTCSWTGGGAARLLVVGVVAVAVAWVAIGSHSPSSPSVADKRGLRSFPLVAQATVSRSLGADDRRFFARRRGAALHAVNPAQSFRARFDRRGALVRAAGGTVGLALAGVGRGRRLEAVRGVAPRAQRNRVVYRHAGIRGWWANGPAGLEQGFTLAHPPAPGAHGPLRIALSRSGSLQPDLAAGGRSVVFRDARRRPMLRYSGLSVLDAHDRRLDARMRLRDGRVELRVDDAGAAYPLRVDPVLQSTAKLTASDGAADAQLGYSVAVSGDTIVAGAPHASVAANSWQGAVYVFVKPASRGWANATETARLTASDGDQNDELGWSVAVSGNTIVAGAGTAGAAYVFVKPPSGGWQDAAQTAKLTSSDGAAGDALGSSVAVSGDTIVAGAPAATVGSNDYRGAAYVFVKPPSGGWADGTQTAKLTASDGAQFDQLGSSVAMSGDTIVAGAPSAPVGTTNPGAAYVFVKPPSGGWQDAAQTAKLTSSDGAADDALGSSVAVSGDTIVAGAPVWAGSSNASPGAAYVFVKPSSGAWASATQTAKLTASDGAAGNQLGYSVAVGEDRVAAVAPNAAVGANSSQGAAYVFVESASGGWAKATQTAKLTASDGAADERLGWSVAVSGDMIVAGAPYADVGADTDRGAAYVFADATAPAIVITTPADGATYATGQRVQAGYACTDEPGGSGIRSCTGTVADGATIDTSTPGAHTFVVTATDNAGNRSSKSVRYTVQPAATRTPTPTTTACPAGTSPSVTCRPDPDGSGLRMQGTPAAETLIGTSAGDTIVAGGGDDRIAGRGGRDRISAGRGDDTVRGGSGDDHASGHSGDDRIYGQHGRDLLYGGHGQDRVRGGTDGDRLHGGTGDDRLRGDDGNDGLWGDDGHDHLQGNRGDDNLRGGKADDDLRGGKGDDRLRGDRGRDHVRGDRGHDRPEEPRIR